MNTIDQLNAQAAEFTAELAKVRAEYLALGLLAMNLLMARTRTHYPDDALKEEARQRIKRRAWAATTTERTVWDETDWNAACAALYRPSPPPVGAHIMIGTPDGSILTALIGKP